MQGLLGEWPAVGTVASPRDPGRMPIDAYSRLPASIALRRAKGLELAASGSTGSRVFSQGVEVLSGMRQCVAEQDKVATLLKAG